MARPTAALLCLVLGLACMHTALGHAGSMHLENDPVDRNYQPRFVIGTCSPWQTLNPAANYALNGTAEIYVYPYRNCTEQKSSALVIDGYLTKDGLPAGYYNVSGEGYTGTCGTNSSLYVQDPASTNLNENRIWWRPFRTENVTGKFFGTAANSILIRSLAANGTFLDNSLRSFQLATPADGPILCCDITYDTTRNLTQEALSTALEANGVNICTSPPPPAPSPPPSGQLLPPAPPPPPGSAAALSMSSTAVAAAALLLALLL